MSSPRPLLLLIDGHSLAYRCYHAYRKSQEGGLVAADGTPTNICYGFIKALINAINYQKPNSIIIAFDIKQPTFRHLADPNYKSNRSPTPDDFYSDINKLFGIITAIGIPMAKVAGYEADDVLGSLATIGSQSGYRVKIQSGDKDMFQLVDDENQISVLYQTSAKDSNSRSDITEMDQAGVLAKIGVRADQIVDYKSLCGDKSDCINGIRGIGHKGALKLLVAYQNLDNIYDNIDKIKGTLKQQLILGKPEGYHSRMLARIVTSVPVNVSFDDAKLKPFDLRIVSQLLKDREIGRFAMDLQDAIFATNK